MKTDFSNAPGTLHILTERDESGHILQWPTSDGTLWNTVASMRELFFLGTDPRMSENPSEIANCHKVK